MSEYRQKMLNKEQNALIDKYQESLLNVPVDIVKLAKEFGVKKVYTAIFEEGQSGAIFKEEDGSGFAIYSNKAEPLARQRFTYAHELAHFLLHKDHIGDGISENALYRGGLSNEFEVQANKIAADILMPQIKLEEAITQRKIQDLSEITAIFGVSKATILIRLGIPNE